MKAAIRSSKVTFSSPNPKLILNSLNNSPPITAPIMPTRKFVHLPKPSFFKRDRAPSERSCEASDDNPHDDLADVHASSWPKSVSQRRPPVSDRRKTPLEGDSDRESPERGEA
jgi:hypothetical protein